MFEFKYLNLDYGQTWYNSFAGRHLGGTYKMRKIAFGESKSTFFDIRSVSANQISDSRVNSFRKVMQI